MIMSKKKKKKNLKKKNVKLSQIIYIQKSIHQKIILKMKHQNYKNNLNYQKYPYLKIYHLKMNQKMKKKKKIIIII